MVDGAGRVEGSQMALVCLTTVERIALGTHNMFLLGKPSGELLFLSDPRLHPPIMGSDVTRDSPDMLLPDDLLSYDTHCVFGANTFRKL